MIDGDTIMCISNDTNFVFLGIRNILQLSSFKVRGTSRKKKRLIDIGITTLYSDLFDRINQNVIGREHITSIVAKYPIFYHIPNSYCMVRALCAIIIGNDTNQGGIKGVGPLLVAKTIIDIYKKSEALTEDDIITQIYGWIKSKKFSNDELLCIRAYAEAFIYKP